MAASELPDRTRSFESFYEAERPRVLAICHALAGGHSAAEDVAQEAFVRAYLQWDRVRDMEWPGAWIRRVASNLATSRRRRLAVEARALLRMTPPTQLEEMHEPEDAFWQAVRLLPGRQAQAVALRYADDLTVADIADVMGCAEGTVKAHLHAARTTLAARLGLEDEAAR